TDTLVDTDGKSVPLYIYIDDSDATGINPTSYTLVNTWFGDTGTQFGPQTPQKDGVFCFTDTGHEKMYVYLLDPVDASLSMVRAVSYEGDDYYLSSSQSRSLAFTGETVYMTGPTNTGDDTPSLGVVTVYSGPATPVVHSMSASPTSAHCKDDTTVFSVTLSDEDGNTLVSDIQSHLVFTWLVNGKTYSPASVTFGDDDVYTVTFSGMADAADEAMTSVLSVSTSTEAVAPFFLSEAGAAVEVDISYSEVASASLLGGTSYFANGKLITLEFAVYDTLGSSISDDRSVTLTITSDDVPPSYTLIPNQTGTAYTYSVGILYTCATDTMTLTVASTQEGGADHVFPFEVVYFTDAVYVTERPGTVVVGDTASLSFGAYDKCKSLIPQNMGLSVGWWGLSDPTLSPTSFDSETSLYTADMYVDPSLAKSGITVIEAKATRSVYRVPPPIMAPVSVSVGTITTLDISPRSVRAGTGDATFTFTPYNENGIVMASDSVTFAVYFEDQPEARYLSEPVPCVSGTCQTQYSVTVGNHIGVIDRSMVVSAVSPTTPESTLTVEIAYTIPWFYYAIAVVVVGVLAGVTLLYLQRDDYKKQYRRLAFADDEVETLDVEAKTTSEGESV
ncbi:hypothetical protein KIPB_002872, partial [Kipferlia bialata]